MSGWVSREIQGKSSPGNFSSSAATTCKLPLLLREFRPAASRKHEAEILSQLHFFFSIPCSAEGIKKKNKNLFLLLIVNHSENKPGFAEPTAQSEGWESWNDEESIQVVSGCSNVSSLGIPIFCSYINYAIEHLFFFNHYYFFFL